MSDRLADIRSRYPGLDDCCSLDIGGDIEWLLEELARLRELHLHGCECAEDQACQWIRERDEARAEAERLRRRNREVENMYVDLYSQLRAAEEGMSYTSGAPEAPRPSYTTSTFPEGESGDDGESGEKK